MNVAGPSRAQPGRLAAGRRVESTYEEDLLGLVQDLSLDEVEELQTFYGNRTSYGHALSDHDIAMNDLLQQARRLSILNEDIALAQHLAIEEGTAVNLETHPVNEAPNPDQPAIQQNEQTTRQRQNRNPLDRIKIRQSKTWGRWVSVVFGWVASPGRARAP
ncbi:hypothetical protein PAXRUDRAFT_99371, partial [Paxillus rubicundulus Ve08.2h10]